MEILYVSTLCSKPKFKQIFDGSTVKPQQQAQKFHDLLSQGLLSSVNSLYHISRAPIEGLNSHRILTKQEIEIYNNVTYHYLPSLEIPIIKRFIFFLSGFVNSFSWCSKYRKTQKVIVCDILNLSLTTSVLIISKLFRVNSLAVVTDLPDYMGSSEKNISIKKNINLKMYKFFCNLIVTHFDYYVLLTEQMNEKVNPQNKPHIIVEGMVDIHMEDVTNDLNAKYSQKIVLYAGALYEKYGIKTLLDAFSMISDDDVQLWLFGSGDMDEAIHNYELKDRRIQFFGVVPNERVVQEQLKATVLVNPRPTAEAFTKYSFPSKNMEYMVSGTPVITTELPGMPQEYREYVYLFDDETSEGLYKTLIQVLRKDREELHQKGLDAKTFVLKNKNNIEQARKIIELVGQEINRNGKMEVQSN